MKKFSGTFRLPLVLLVASLIASAASVAGNHGEQKMQKDIVETAVSAGNFNTLVAAVEAAGLVDTLKGEGPFTVFAPTDEAFAQLPQEDLQALLADKEALTKVLTYHVLPKKVLSGHARSLSSAKTVNGDVVQISGSYSAGNGIKVDGANIIKSDIVASNGVIHVIDRVIVPRS